MITEEYIQLETIFQNNFLSFKLLKSDLPGKEYGKYSKNLWDTPLTTHLPYFPDHMALPLHICQLVLGC